MDLEYKYMKDIEIEKLVELFSSVGWESAKYPNKLYGAIKNSDLVISVWREDELVGLISTISDGYINVFITYLLIKPSYQKQKIGTNLMKFVIITKDFEERYCQLNLLSKNFMKDLDLLSMELSCLIITG